jgi:D-alanyl-D-alanine carboxypeptidase/D-alanyl-D-alanine-endopeptidase (penicillin-binding protein 4)
VVSKRRGTSKKVARRRAGTRKVKWVRVKGRNGRYRWKKVYVKAPTQYYRTGIQSFLTESWSNGSAELPPAPAAGAATSTAFGTASDPKTAPALAKPVGDPTTAPALSNPNGDPDAAVPVNPIVQAYADSLSVRGYNPDSQGLIVQTLGGELIAEHNADRPFNPASVVKVATSLAALSRLGPSFRFRTSIYTDGVLDRSTGTLHGSLYLVGSGDPAFFYENALLIADKLNRNGIRAVDGHLYVLGPFYFNLSGKRETAAAAFRKTLAPETWTPGAKKAYVQFLAMRDAEQRLGDEGDSRGASASGGQPSLKITGKTITDATVNTAKLHLLAVHTSLPLVRVLKGLNDFSNNWMATVIGNMVGGPMAVQAFLRTEVGLKDEELSIITPSGLGSNQISPRATVQILGKLLAYLRKHGLGIEEMLPVAGIDAGTLMRRFTDTFRGSVVGKTGTLSGVSALAGVAFTRNRGPLLFVIYNHGGSPHAFRSAQDETIKALITYYGGPVPVNYSPSGAPGVSETSTDSANQNGNASARR